MPHATKLAPVVSASRHGDAIANPCPQRLQAYWCCVPAGSVLLRRVEMPAQATGSPQVQRRTGSTCVYRICGGGALSTTGRVHATHAGRTAQGK